MSRVDGTTATDKSEETGRMLDRAAVTPRALICSRDDLDSRMADALSRLLGSGIVLSSAMILMGLAIMLVVGDRSYPVDGSTLLATLRAPAESNPAIPTALPLILDGLSIGHPLAIITFGLWLLLAIPVARVATMLVLFARNHDRVFAAFSLVVLVVLLTSISGVIRME